MKEKGSSRLPVLYFVSCERLARRVLLYLFIFFWENRAKQESCFLGLEVRSRVAFTLEHVISWIEN